MALIGDVKYFTIIYDGLEILITATQTAAGVQLEVKVLEGSADINALYWGNGDDDADFGGFAKKDSNLNMNGTDEAWDGAAKLSSPGLGKEGATKPTFLTEGESLFHTISGASLDDIVDLGVRATSTSTAEGSIKGVGVEHLPVIDVQKAADPTTVDEGSATEVTYTYEVKNASTHDLDDELTLVSLVDDNGTVATDDDVDLLTGFVAGSSYGSYYVGGDTDGDYKIDHDLNEVWEFSYTTTLAAMNAGDSVTNIVTAEGTSHGIEVSDTATATVEAINVDPVVHLEKTANVASVEDSGPVIYSYAVTNLSPAGAFDPLTITDLVDDNGTPLNTADDVSLVVGGVLQGGVTLVKTGGDQDALLEIGETWTYSTTINVTIADGSSHTNTAVVTATDDEGNTTTDDDTATVVNPPDTPPEDHFPEFSSPSISHVTFYFETGDDPFYAGDTSGLLDTTPPIDKSQNDPDGWFTVKFNDEATPELSDDLDDWFDDAMDYIAATFPDLDLSTLEGVSIKGGTTEVWYELDGNPDDDDSADAPTVWIVADKEVDASYDVTVADPFTVS